MPGEARTCRVARRARRRGGLKSGLSSHWPRTTRGGRKLPRARPALSRAGPREDYTLRAIPSHAPPPVRRLGMRPQDGRDHPPSLSISISGGEETYEDSPSNGERTGTCPAWESGRPAAARIVVWRSVLSDGPGPSPLERGAGEGESPVRPEPCRNTRRCRRVGLFGNAALIGR